MKEGKKILDKIESIGEDIDRIERKMNAEPKIATSVQHSLIWGGVVMGIGIIILFAIKIAS